MKAESTDTKNNWNQEKGMIKENKRTEISTNERQLKYTTIWNKKKKNSNTTSEKSALDSTAGINNCFYWKGYTAMAGFFTI